MTRIGTVGPRCRPPILLQLSISHSYFSGRRFLPSRKTLTFRVADFPSSRKTLAFRVADFPPLPHPAQLLLFGSHISLLPQHSYFSARRFPAPPATLLLFGSPIYPPPAKFFIFGSPISPPPAHPNQLLNLPFNHQLDLPRRASKSTRKFPIQRLR